MVWLVCSVLLTLVGACGTVININRWRFDRRFALEVRAIVTAPSTGVADGAGAELPPPVARYRQLAVRDRAPVRSLRLRHGGTFRAPNTPVRFPGFDYGARRPAPGLGEHTAEVLAEAGYSAADIERLRGLGAVT